MRPYALLLTGLLAVLAPGLTQAQEDVRKMTDDSRKLAVRLLDQVRSEVVRELEATGPLRAIVVCKYSAPEITSTVSRQSGVRVTRISLRPRNRALGEPDAWEQETLLDFEKRASKGEKADGMERAELVTEPAGRYFRYVKAIPMSAVCATCHGSTISDAVRSVIAADYPYDRATDYAVGQVRGAISVKKPLF